jgi:hypothetical protein
VKRIPRVHSREPRPTNMLAGEVRYDQTAGHPSRKGALVDGIAVAFARFGCEETN